MDASYLLVLGFCTWTLLLVLGLGAGRISLMLRRKRRIDSFGPSGEKGIFLSHRIGRAHANCLENLPLVIGIIFYASMTNQLEVTNGLALFYLAARLAQSITHILSVSVAAIAVRFSFFVVQCAILLYWLYCLWV